MISKFDLTRIVPRFILNDKNGYAIAKAMEAALNFFLAKCQEGLDCLQDVDKMPEWRLDEMAWECGCLYDENAGIEQKREWIRNATPLYAIWGTKKSVAEYLKGYFGEIEVEENWQYGGEPFHFRMTVGGEWTPENEAWARRAVEMAKNVRSVLDDLSAGTSFTILVSAMAEWWRFYYPVTGNYSAGTWPEIVKEGIIDAGGAVISAPAEAYVFPYPRAGTKPDVAKLGAEEKGVASVDVEEGAYTIPYVVCGGDGLF